MMISVVFVRGLLVELQSRGFALDQARRALGVSEDDVLDVRARLPAVELNRIVMRALRATADPGLGLDLGNHAPDTMLRTLGMLVLSGRTLRHAFSLFERYVPLLVDGMSWRLVEDGPRASFVYTCTGQFGAGSRFAAEFTFAMTLRIAEKFMPHANVRPLAVMFQHDEPEYVERYEPVFNCPIAFRQESNALVFDRELLDAPQPFADAMTHDVFLELAERDLMQLGGGPRLFADRVRAQLQHDIGATAVGGRAIARALGLTSRQLRRRLAMEGASMTELLNEARRDFALTELRHGTPIQQISERLGFSERSAFHRAFRRWTGDTPQSYLSRLRHESWVPLLASERTQARANGE